MKAYLSFVTVNGDYEGFMFTPNRRAFIMLKRETELRSGFSLTGEDCDDFILIFVPNEFIDSRQYLVLYVTVYNFNLERDGIVY